MQKTKSRQRLSVIVVNGIIMALYLALTILVAPVSSGPIQFRISESLNHLVVFNRKLLWEFWAGSSSIMPSLDLVSWMWFWWWPNIAFFRSDSFVAKQSKKCKDAFSIEHDLLYHQHGIDCLYASSDRWPSILDNLWYTCIKRVHHHGCFSTTDVLFRSFA